MGAGLLGVGTALELARRGCRVDLFERNAEPLLEASAVGEGKLHLGFLYAADPTRRTGSAMVRGACVFLDTVERWLGGQLPDAAFSSPFVYAVHRDSLVTPSEFERHLLLVESELLETARFRYPHWDGSRRVSQLSSGDREAVFGESVVAAYQTPEVAIDPLVLRPLLLEAMGHESRITLHTSTAVGSVEGGDDRFHLQTADDMVGPFDHVVNAAWAGRLELDATRGIVPDRPWLFRYKAGLDIEGPPVAPEILPSTTIVLGPFGDVVNRGQGRWHLSWYPVGRLRSTSHIRPELPSRSEELFLVEDVLSGLELVLPALSKLRGHPTEVRGGVIFAWGDHDIDITETALHERFDIGPRSYGNYHTVDTGKLTTAPLFAVETADRIAPRP